MELLEDLVGVGHGERRVGKGNRPLVQRGTALAEIVAVELVGVIEQALIMPPSTFTTPRFP